MPRSTATNPRSTAWILLFCVDGLQAHSLPAVAMRRVVVADRMTYGLLQRYTAFRLAVLPRFDFGFIYVCMISAIAIAPNVLIQYRTFFI